LFSEKRGDLLVRFNVKYPHRLGGGSRKTLLAALCPKPRGVNKKLKEQKGRCHKHTEDTTNNTNKLIKM